MNTSLKPHLERAESEGVAVWFDPGLAEAGILVAFPERAGGVSHPPYESLNLAAHVGDDPSAVDANRSRLLRAVGLPELTGQLVTAEQVHGAHIELIGLDDAGRGAFADHGRAPVSGTDGLATRAAGVPLLLLYADCVPVVVAAPDVRAVALVHAGWRGALAGIPGAAARLLRDEFGARADRLLAYVGPHIGACCYPVGDDVISQFANTFVTVARAVSGHLDLDAAVSESLEGAGVDRKNVCRVGACTAESTSAFFSYRAEGGLTGRHGALACIVEGGLSLR